MKFGMNQVQVPPFDLKLRQDEATTSRNPPECPPPPKNALRGALKGNLRWSLSWELPY